ncbi:ABC transporter ATP-binding protein [Tissierella sp. Yu-01]|uniref:ABC transporter ATP-binding protein n=1 Tax=Tissierella sp. Yu-01 TaxID=3035694 RepID=UPI00240D621C|nr:ABC transporter ATP-binding protein [Tissierella sp. Yu-01]WFA10081.1 ABC transporter ATP-binding protein [Tissierella sp. Yu-01]
MKNIQGHNLTLGYENNIIIDDVSIEFPMNKITILIGANGCGKSTMLRSFARLLKPTSGDIELNGRSISSLSNKQISKELAILPQSPVVSGSITVRELVEMGRFPYQNWRNKLDKKDNEMIEKALKDTNMIEFSDRTLDSLSGGQRQRVWIAMVLAQDTDIILLDEPTTYLDVTYQIDILDLVYKLNKEEGKTIVMVLHDLNLSCRYADHIIALKNKKIYKQGTPEEVVTKEVVKHIFDMDCEIIKDPLYKTPMFVPYSSAI